MKIRTTVSRHHPDLPRLAVVPPAAIAAWKLAGTTTIEGTINGHDLGRRSIKRWDDERWWIDLPALLCRAAAIDVGDEVTLDIRVAAEELPSELASLIASNNDAKRAWDALTKAQQRMLREDVAAAKNSATRERRARKYLT